jgi:hypothetical protein
MIYHVSTTIQDCIHERYYSFRKPKWMPIKIFSWLIKKIFIQLSDAQVASEHLFRTVKSGKISFAKMADNLERDLKRRKYDTDNS